MVLQTCQGRQGSIEQDTVGSKLSKGFRRVRFNLPFLEVRHRLVDPPGSLAGFRSVQMYLNHALWSPHGKK